MKDQHPAMAAVDGAALRAEMAAQRAVAPDGGADLTMLRTRAVEALAIRVGCSPEEARQTADGAVAEFLRVRNEVVLRPGALETLVRPP